MSNPKDDESFSEQVTTNAKLAHINEEGKRKRSYRADTEEKEEKY